MFDEIEIRESLSHGAITEELTGRKYRVRLIEGDVIGTSGFYPSGMLRRCAGIFKAGTPMFFDHLSAEESTGPNMHGSVSKLAAKLVSDAVYENDGLYADIEVYEHQMPLIKALKDDIGISIRAQGRAQNKVIQGKSIPVFSDLLVARSADFVVKAGAGGKIVSILESAQEEEVQDMTVEITEADREAIADRIAAKLTASVESAAETKTEAVVDYAKVVELAEALAGSSLDAEGRSRVLELHKANGKPIADLITAEESYRTSLVPKQEEATQEAAEAAGRTEETTTTEAVEAAGASERTLPARWTKGK